MIRDSRFLISRRPYAVDLTSLRGGMETRHDGGHYYQGRIDAVWFRRRKGVTVACIGTLWDLQDEQPADAVTFLERHTDGRYGGHCDGRWDGKSYWGNVTLDEQAKHLTVLQPMLAAYPAIPDGYDGWWRFLMPDDLRERYAIGEPTCTGDGGKLQRVLYKRVHHFRCPACGTVYYSIGGRVGEARGRIPSRLLAALPEGRPVDA